MNASRSQPSGAREPISRAAPEALTKKELRCLSLAAGDGGGLYPGIQWDFRGRVFDKLSRLGLVRGFTPHNPAHKYRAVATERGLALLAEKEPT